MYGYVDGAGVPSQSRSRKLNGVTVPVGMHFEEKDTKCSESLKKITKTKILCNKRGRSRELIVTGESCGAKKKKHGADQIAADAEDAPQW